MLRVRPPRGLSHACHILTSVTFEWGMGYRSWLRHYATSRKVAGSIPEEVIGFFNWPNPSSRTMTLGSTQPITKMSTRNLSCGAKGGRRVRLEGLGKLKKPLSVCQSGAVLSPYVSLFQVPRCLLGPCTAAIDVCPFGLLYISPMIDWLMRIMIFWSNWWNKFGRGNKSPRRKPAPAPLCPPQNPTWRPGLEPRTAAVGSQRLTAWAMARPSSVLTPCVIYLFNKHLLYICN
jgi:hypothetical protein